MNQGEFPIINPGEVSAKLGLILRSNY